MKKLLILALSALLISPVMAQEAQPADATAVCKDGSYSTAKSVRGACARHGGVDKWLKEPAANEPKAAVAPSDATAVCKDGSYTKAKSTRGACARHGGVDKWLVEPTADDEKAAKEERKERKHKEERVETTNDGQATALCKDGSYSYSKTHKGTCSRHGGVDKWLKD